METAPHSIARYGCSNAAYSDLYPSCMNPEAVKDIVQAFNEKTGFREATVPLNPVILLPGLGASGLQAALDRVRCHPLR